MQIPNSAFISNFTMIIKGNEYVSLVDKKEDAKEMYNTALASGFGAGKTIEMICEKQIQKILMISIQV